LRALALLAATVCMAAPAAGQDTHLVVISGLSGEPRYADSFYEWAVTLMNAAQGRWGVPESNVTYLAEKVERDPTRIAARSTRENVEAVLRDLAGRAAADDQIFIILIGHGSTREGESQINLPGPDMSGREFAKLLDLYPTQKICFVNAASASGGFIPALSGENRTIITATKTGREKNETIFAAHFVDAYASDVADVDKDERVSALEAFNYASREVARAYEADGKLLTEHAMLDDNGDGEGSREPDPQVADGRLARTQFLTGRSATLASGELPADPQLAGLYQEKQDLEERVAALRDRKNQMVPEAYELELERLLVELALKNREIRELEGEGK
jgi:hypothetical protein